MPGTVPGSGRWDGSRVGEVPSPGSSRSGERGQSEGGRVEQPRGRPYDGSIEGSGAGRRAERSGGLSEAVAPQGDHSLHCEAREGTASVRSTGKRPWQGVE